VRLTGAAPCTPHEDESRTVETGLIACRLSGLRACRGVPGAVLSSGISWSSVSGFLSDSV